MGRAFEYRRASKEARWDKMSKTFPKIGKAITMAAKESGNDPVNNSKLRLAIQAAKAANMPKDNVDAAIKRASGKDAVDIKEINYEGKGPHGVMIFVECATDNTNRSIANIKTYFNKSSGQILPSGALDFLFKRKAVIEFDVTDAMNLEEIELGLIDSGLEELEIEDGRAYAYGDFTEFGSLTAGVEGLGIEIKKATLQRIPDNPQDFTEEQMNDIEILLDKLDEDEDVQAVFTNVN
ncbi:MAG: YebC/PmpR family DNA-binding transcriptional regulator [Verrucomicrobiales bacterium]|jgi:YebC/PmpR family DNA-binding regulatory protein|nr:YebC/PmpR family DNA-binding transcriptional regulator [Verrucomicrobiales bacterium]MBP9223270.1 YebC/PmpR family DNA-binding transcriptional regulator [Verrucomicrobiales bacterium]HQZ27663.1 YebC/PmpR family DNA-binding transcriptional regulator [Verrucomicrobiales bacterium]